MTTRVCLLHARVYTLPLDEREREREIPLVSLTPVTLLLFFPPWISSCARRTVDVRRKGGRRIPLAEGQRQRERERERGVVAGLYGGEREREREGEARGDAAGRGRWCAGDGTGSETRASANQSL